MHRQNQWEKQLDLLGGLLAGKNGLSGSKEEKL
jgi:hypothetical protein